MIIITGYDGGTPTRRFTTELRGLLPDLFDTQDSTRADLKIVPRPTFPESRHPADAVAWYDMYWAHPDAVERPGWEVSQSDSYVAIEHTTITHLGTLPPPPAIPVEQRLAAAPPATLDGWREQDVDFVGGPDKALEVEQSRISTGIRTDRTVDAFDWPGHAATCAATIRALGPAPKLTPAQRARVAVVELITAHARVDAARQSLMARLANAAAAGEPVELSAIVLQHCAGPAGRDAKAPA